MISSSPRSKIRAVKLALKQRHKDDETQFYFSSTSSDSDSIAPASPHNQHLQQRRDHHHHHITYSPNPPNKPRQVNDTDTESIISISSSAFDSERIELDRIDKINNNDDGDRDDNNTSGTIHEPPVQPHTCSAEKGSYSQRILSRIAAYRAARSGSFDTWSSFFSPVTAGNNHTDEEIEL